MIGEFYLRSILGLNQLIHDYPERSDKDLHLYLHFFESDKHNILHGHRLLLGGLPQTFKVNTFLSLVQDSSCKCFETLAFCGYELIVNTSHAGGDAVQSFSPSGEILSVSPTSLATLRRDILQSYHCKDSMLKQKIRQHRQEVLLQRGVRKDKIGNVDDWKIIALTDRKYRRVWLNIDASVKTCEKFMPFKVICTKLNVEEARSPEEQLLMHASLDSLIGVHGSQFTNGIFLPRHSFIVELLPWIKYLPGKNWAARTSAPTPMGAVFGNSNLHHLGYCLGRDSVPLCEHVNRADTESDEACLKNKTIYSTKFYWELRDFNVNADIIDKFISTFIIHNSTDCDDMRTRGKENNFILFNVFCSHAVNGTNIEFSAKHFYQERCEFK